MLAKCKVGKDTDDFDAVLTYIVLKTCKNESSVQMFTIASKMVNKYFVSSLMTIYCIAHYY